MVKVAEMDKTQIHMELQEGLNSQNDFEKEQSQKIHIYWFQNLLQSCYSNQNSVILAYGKM